MKTLVRSLIVILLCSMLRPAVFAADSSQAQAPTEDSKIAFETLKSYGIVDDSLHNNTTVNRKDCVIAIMKLIGATSKLEEVYKNINFAHPTFRDFYDPYIWEAAHLGIVFGRIGEDGDSYFYPDSFVTAKETVAIIVRCLVCLGDNYDKISEVGLNETYTKAIEIGVVQNTDAFYENSDVTLTQDEFCTLLYRVLYMPRYKFCDDEKTSNPIDITGTTRYIDCLTKVAQ